MTADTVRTARPGEVARMLGVDPKTVSRYAVAGRIPCSTTPSGHRRFNLNEVRAALSVAAPAGVSGPESLAFELEQIEAELARLTVRMHAVARVVVEYLT